MTTIACNLKEMAADTQVTWEGVGGDAYSGIKLASGNGAVFGITGGNCDGSITALDWLISGGSKESKPLPPDYDHDWDWKIIELSPKGIAIYNERLEKEENLEPLLAVGSGRKVALYCMKYLHMSPAEAVAEACKIDHWSNIPIYVINLMDGKLVKWAGKPKRKKEKKTIVSVVETIMEQGKKD